MAGTEGNEFHWADYLVFALFLATVLGIGVYNGLIAGRKKKKTAKDMLLGGGSMPAFPVALSLLASVLSAPFIISIPVEIYANGITYCYIIIGYIVGAPVVIYFFIPMFYKLNLTSAYEYLEKRFNRQVKSMASVVFILMMLIYMGVVIYAPSLAMERATGVDFYVIILAIGAVSIIYTVLGGMKAIVWADVMQMTVITLSLLLVIIFGTIKAGGPGVVFEKSLEGGRLNFNTFTFNPWVVHSFWTQLSGGIGIMCSLAGANQSMIQRFLTVGNKKGAQMALTYGTGFFSFLTILVAAVGLVMYAVYSDCDPLTSPGSGVPKADVLVPHFVLEVLGSLPGLPGLFLAAVSAATISTLSGGVTALATVTLIDVVKPVYSVVKNKSLEDSKCVLYTRIMSILFGIAAVGLAFLAPYMGDKLLDIALGLFGIGGGPLLGLFILGLFVPCCNSWGASVSLVSSLLVNIWIATGKTITGASARAPLFLNTSGCPVDVNLTTLAPPTTTASLLTTVAQEIGDESGFKFDDIYKLSYMHYSLLAVLVSIPIGLIVSYLTGCMSKDGFREDYIYPYPNGFTCCYKVRKGAPWVKTKMASEDMESSTTQPPPYSTEKARNGHDISPVKDSIVVPMDGKEGMENPAFSYGSLSTHL